MNMNVKPMSFCKDLRRLRTSAWMDTSSAATASSAITKRGSDTSALAIEIRCRWPPEKA